jgi:hypothetical protein
MQTNILFDGTGDDVRGVVKIKGPSAGDKRKENVLLIDVSGSMGLVLPVAKAALENLFVRFVGNFRCCVIVFHSEPVLLLKMSDVTEAVYAQSMQALDELRADGLTDIQKALEFGIEQFSPEATTRNMFILTDGKITKGDEDVKIPEHVRMFAIGVGEQCNHDTLQKLAKSDSVAHVRDFSSLGVVLAGMFSMLAASARLFVCVHAKNANFLQNCSGKPSVKHSALSFVVKMDHVFADETLHVCFRLRKLAGEKTDVTCTLIDDQQRMLHKQNATCLSGTNHEVAVQFLRVECADAIQKSDPDAIARCLKTCGILGDDPVVNWLRLRLKEAEHGQELETCLTIARELTNERSLDACESNPFVPPIMRTMMTASEKGSESVSGLCLVPLERCLTLS